MKKAILESKWYFYIPIISLFFIHEMSEWIFKPEKTIDRAYRMVTIECTTILHAIPIIGIVEHFVN